MKGYHWFIIPLFLFLLCVPQHISYADEITYHNVLKINLSDSEKTVPLYYAMLYYDGKCSETFDWNESEDLRQLLTLNNEEIKVSVEVLDHSYVDASTLKYDTSVYWGEDGRLRGSIDFSRPNSQDGEGDIFPPLKKPIIETEKLKLLTTKKGFHPSKNNYLTIYVCNYIDRFIDLWEEDTILGTQVRIVNSEGKCVFYEKYDMTEDVTYQNVVWDGDMADTSYATPILHAICDLHWKGKPSKKNEAGLNVKKYIPDGTYTVEATTFISCGNLVFQSEPVSTTLVVNSAAPKGYNGQKKSARIPIYTGDAQVDYLAEKICKAAGVKMNMSDDKKIKKIYTYMTKNFKHFHSYKKKKKFYNVKKMTAKIQQYKTASDIQYAESKIMYNYIDTRGIRKAMEYRGGVCDYNAAIFMILCNHVGVVSYRCGGYYVNSSGSYSPHAWNMAVVNGKIYYYDIDVEIQNYRKGQKSFHWYKKTYKQSCKNHEMQISAY